MGKDRSKDRTKHQPASSSEAATLLTPPGTGGLAAALGFGSSGGLSSIIEDVTSQNVLSAEYQLPFKALSKKDSITKTKALQELSSLFANLSSLDESSISLVLKHWSQGYTRLAYDNDWRVRVAVNETLTFLANSVKKQLATILKIIFPYWLNNIFDTNREVSATATVALNAAIPARKQAEAVNFCKNEILYHVKESLAQTPQTLKGDIKVVEAEVAQEKYERVISANIATLAHLIESLSDNDNMQLTDQYNILIDAKLWNNFFSHKSSVVIRKSSYKLLKVLCVKLPKYVEDNLEKLSPLVLGIFQEKDYLAYTEMWELLLTFMKSFPASWKHVNFRKQIFPRFKSFLSHGGNSASTVNITYASLLPFLAMIPVDVIGTGPEFSAEFFTQLWLGLETDIFFNNKAGSLSLIKSYAECLLWFVSQSRKTHSNIEGILMSDRLLFLLQFLLSCEKLPVDAVDLVQVIAETYIKITAQNCDLEGASLFWNNLEKYVRSRIDGVLSGSDVLTPKLLAIHVRKAPPSPAPEKKEPANENSNNSNPNESSGEKVKNPKPRDRDNLSLEIIRNNNSDINLFVERLGLFLSKVVSATSPEYKANTQVYSLIIRFGKNVFDLLLTQSRDQRHTYFLRLLSDIAKEISLSHLTDLTTFYPNTLLPWISEWLVTFHRDSFAVLCRLLAVYFNEIAKLSADWKLQWKNLIETIVGLPSQTLESRVQAVIIFVEEVCCDDKWLTEALDSLAVKLMHNLQVNDIPGDIAAVVQKTDVDFIITQREKEISMEIQPQTVSRFLALVIGSNHSNGYLVSQNTASQILSQVSAHLQQLWDQTVIFNGHSNFQTQVSVQLSSRSATQQQIFLKYIQLQQQKIVGLLEVAFGFVNSLHQHPSFTVDLLKNIFIFKIYNGLYSNNNYASGKDNTAKTAAETAVTFWNELVSSKKLDSILGTSHQLFVKLVVSLVHSRLIDEHKIVDHTGILLLRDLVGDLLSISTEEQQQQSIFDLLLPSKDKFSQFREQALSKLQKQTALYLDLALAFDVTSIPSDKTPLRIDSQLLVYMHLAEFTAELIRKFGSEKSFLGSSPREWLFSELLYEHTCAVLFFSSERTFHKSAAGSLESINIQDEIQHFSTSVGTFWRQDVWPYLFASKSSPMDLLKSAGAMLYNLSSQKGDLHSITLGLLFQQIHLFEPLNTSLASSILGHFVQQYLLPHCKDPSIVSGAAMLGTFQNLCVGLILSSQSEDFTRIQDHFLASLEEQTRAARDLASLKFEFTSKLLEILSVAFPIGLSHKQGGPVLNFLDFMKKQDYANRQVNVPVVLDIALAKFLAKVVCATDHQAIHFDWEFIIHLCLFWFKQSSSQSSYKQSLLWYHAMNLLCGISGILHNSEDDVISSQTKQVWEKAKVAMVDTVLEKFGELDAGGLRESDSERVVEKMSTILSSNWISLGSFPAKLDPIYKLLLSKNFLVQKTVFIFLHRIIRAELPHSIIVIGQNDNANINQDEEAISIRFNPALQTIWENESYAKTNEPNLKFGYFTAWSLLVHWFSVEKKKELRSDLGVYLRRNRFASGFFGSVFNIISNSNLILTNILDVYQLLNQFGMTYQESVLSLSGYLFYVCFKNLPVLVRIWWSDDLDRKQNQLVEKFTIKNISPLLVVDELNTVIEYQQKQKPNPADDSEFSVKVSKVSSEVTAIYKKDDVALTIVIRIPPSYPLKFPEVESASKMGVSEAQSRKWFLSMTTLLLTQDGSILDAVLLWKSNLDKHFEGVEVCPICYSLFHASNHSLPNLPCKTCRNKFHAACMYNWIKISHKNDCPLCRTPFN